MMFRYVYKQKSRKKLKINICLLSSFHQWLHIGEYVFFFLLCSSVSNQSMKIMLLLRKHSTLYTDVVAVTPHNILVSNISRLFSVNSNVIYIRIKKISGCLCSPIYRMHSGVESTLGSQQTHRLSI